MTGRILDMNLVVKKVRKSIDDKFVLARVPARMKNSGIWNE
jgi:hypothetical protein